jgi:DNA-directed RNA polymerase specialized sigma24 family protein
MTGVLTLLIDEREARTKEDRESAKTEVLLARAGIPVEDIAALTGKKPDAIRKAVQRARRR